MSAANLSCALPVGGRVLSFMLYETDAVVTYGDFGLTLLSVLIASYASVLSMRSFCRRCQLEVIRIRAAC
jgi:hypothetical protein